MAEPDNPSQSAVLSGSLPAEAQPDVAPYTFDELMGIAEAGQVDEIDHERLAESSPYEVGRFLTRLEIDERRAVLRKLNIEGAADVLSEMEADDAAEVIEAMREARAAQILDDLAPDDSVDIIAELDESDRERLLKAVTPETAATVSQLIHYAEDSVGGIMTTEVASVSRSATVKTALKRIRKMSDEIERLNYIYVTDKHKRLVGVLSLRELVFAKPYEKIADIMFTHVVGVLRVDQDQEEAALAMAEHNLQALPVIEEDGRLVGVVTDDDVIDVINQEATEDIQMMLGAGGDEALSDPVWESVTRRSPWLFVNLVTAFLAAWVISLFEHGIQQLPILAAFMPLVASLGGNAGGQTLAITIRTLALGNLGDRDRVVVCLREGLKGGLNGLLVGVVAAIAAGLYGQDAMVGVVVFISTLFAMAYAGVAGAFIPLILKHFNLDPAQSSQIILLATTDIVGFGGFLLLAVILLM